MSTEYDVCRVDQLVEGRGRPARAGDRYLAVFLSAGRVHVLDNECLHAGSPIDGGPVIDSRVHCPWHGWAYDLDTGAHITAYGDRPGLRTYAARIEAGVVKVVVDDGTRDLAT